MWEEIVFDYFADKGEIVMEIITKFIGLIKTYRKTASIVVIGVVGALEAFGFTGLGESLSGLLGAVCGTPAP